MLFYNRMVIQNIQPTNVIFFIVDNSRNKANSLLFRILNVIVSNTFKISLEVQD
jgi:hypothetical protein